MKKNFPDKMKKSGIRTPLLLAVFAFLFLATASGQNTTLGVLEDVPGVYAGEQNSPGVRVVFYKQGTAWEPFPSNCPDQNCLKGLPSRYPSEVAWTIGFNGGTLGHLTAQTPEKFAFYSHVGLQKITSGEQVPTVGQRSKEFGGFLDAAVYRPLVASSQSSFKDPESWKPSPLSPQLIKALRQAFRTKFPTLCKSSAQDETRLVRFPYRDVDVGLVKAYASNKQWAVARLTLKDASDCEGTEAGLIADAWFFVDPQKAVRYLGSGMWLVDAGDYDNDGKSELLFAIDRYNRGGYELFYNDFKGHAVFEFSYH